MNSHSPKSMRSLQSGFTLVELLVAVLILGIGLMGIAKLSVSTVQANGSASMRSQATLMIQQIIDDMHSNSTQALSGAYNIAYGANPGVAPACDAGACSAAQVTTYDLARWVTQLGVALPNGQGQIVTSAGTLNPTTGSTEITVTVSVQWNDTIAQQAFGNAAAPTMTTTMETVL